MIEKSTIPTLMEMARKRTQDYHKHQKIKRESTPITAGDLLLEAIMTYILEVTHAKE